MKTRWLSRLLMAIALLIGLVSTGTAADGKDIVAFRQSVMRLLDGHVSAMMDVVRGRVDFADQLTVHASSIELLSTNLGDLFPVATGPDTLATNALPDIWSDSARFEAAVRALQREAAELNAASKSGDQVTIAAQFSSLRRNSCDACHTSFRRRLSQ